MSMKDPALCRDSSHNGGENMRHSKALAWTLTTLAGLSLAACSEPGSTGFATAPSAVSSGPAAILENAPFEGHDSGTDDYPQSGCTASLMPVRSNGTGTATLIGAYSWHTQECFDNDTAEFSGTFTMTAANGDTIVGTLMGNGTGVLDDVTATYAYRATITGGTGRFSNAAGAFSATGQVNLITALHSQTFSGTISPTHNHS
jgi:hypothetical protein